ncbi:MAG: hypothetical protein HKN47_09025 [Pirellulaceae bacterium]|nr:hypothetical protein [Pirellulaceae bacterium]
MESLLQRIGEFMFGPTPGNGLPGAMEFDGRRGWGVVAALKVWKQSS